jgi:transcriptional regulator with XRE-family HTH domain
MIKAAQIRAGRALLDIPQTELAGKAGIPVATLDGIEQESITPDATTSRAVQEALEVLGVEIIPDGLTSGAAGIGVRLKFTAQVAKRIDILENEGGPVGEDDVRP